LKLIFSAESNGKTLRFTSIRRETMAAETANKSDIYGIGCAKLAVISYQLLESIATPCSVKP
jgi:hypothetical protein